MAMVTVTLNGKKIDFDSYDEYFKWDTERAKKEKEEEERKDREESEKRAKRLASLTEEEKEEINKLEEEIFLIKVSTDFLSQKDYENISNNRTKIREIRGF